MRSITVDASTRYDVLIGDALLDRSGELIRGVWSGKTAAVVSDDNVFPLYGEKVCRSLERSGINVCSFVFPHGERSKNLSTYSELLEFLCEKHITRGDMLVALGGGVTGDMTGFAAATYLRGIPFVQIPTTLLADVDSSVGGKTAVDLAGGKIQVGCFYQPSLVICDTDTLATLPEEEYRCGCAEVIKYGMIGAPGFFGSLAETPARSQLLNVIETCVSMKRDFVLRDEFDRGDRMLLNFGHTFGHAVEKCSGYTVAHGYAVAMGMCAVTKAAEALGRCEKGVYSALCGVVGSYGLPTELPPYPLEDMHSAALSDKKSTGSVVRLIVPESIGRCVIDALSPDELREWMKAGGIK